MRKLIFTDDELKQLIKDTIEEYHEHMHYNHHEMSEHRHDIMLHVIDESMEEIKKQYVNYNFVTLHGFGNPLMKVDGKYVARQPKYGIPIDEAAHIIEETYHLDDWQIIKRKHQLSFVIADIDKNKTFIESDMKYLGYFLSFSEPIDIQGMHWLKMRFEPMRQSDESERIKQYGLLLHISPTGNTENIMKQGITPQSKNKYFRYPNRVYLFKGDIEYRFLKRFGRSMAKANGLPDSNAYTIFEVDTEKLPDNVIFYEDPNLDEGVYTEHAIPPSAIISHYNIYFE